VRPEYTHRVTSHENLYAVEFWLKIQRKRQATVAPEMARCNTKMLRSGNDRRQHFQRALFRMPIPQTIAYVCSMMAAKPHVNNFAHKESC